MIQPHPHSGATYKLIARIDGAFEIEVSIPDTSATVVTNFPTEADAQRWIARHAAAVAAGSPKRPSFRMPGKRS